MSYPRVTNILKKTATTSFLNKVPPKTITPSKVVTNIIKNGEYRFTKDGNFAIKPKKPDPVPGYTMTPEFQTTSDFLYVQTNFSLDGTSALYNLISNGFIVKTGNVQDLTMKRGGIDMSFKYDEYIFSRPLIDERKYDKDGVPIDDSTSINENDCLKFGECLTFANQTNNKPVFDAMLKSTFNPPVLKSTTDIAFGETEYDKDNIKILKTIPEDQKNNFAMPENGESYAIVRKRILSGKAPYHIAFVVYTWNGVNITLEAEADNKNNYQPKFCFYDITPNGNTFHRRWSGELYKSATDDYGINRYQSLYSNGETIVLRSRDISVVMDEMKKEKLPYAKGLLLLPIVKHTKGGKSKTTTKKNIQKKKKNKNKKTITNKKK
jgi:hypothetical protein